MVDIKEGNKIDPRSQLKAIGKHSLAGNYILKTFANAVESGFIVGQAGPGFVVIDWFNGDEVDERAIISIHAIRGDYSIYRNFSDFEQAEIRANKKVNSYLKVLETREK